MIIRRQHNEWTVGKTHRKVSTTFTRINCYFVFYYRRRDYFAIDSHRVVRVRSSCTTVTKRFGPSGCQEKRRTRVLTSWCKGALRRTCTFVCDSNDMSVFKNKLRCTHFVLVKTTLDRLLGLVRSGPATCESVGSPRHISSARYVYNIRS